MTTREDAPTGTGAANLIPPPPARLLTRAEWAQMWRGSQQAAEDGQRWAKEQIVARDAGRP